MELTAQFINQVLAKATPVLSAEKIQQALDQMAKAITAEYADKNPVLLTVMNGGLIPAAELAKRMNFPMQMDYLHATRYRGATSGGEQVHWIKQPSIDLAGRHVLIVDDILDGGLTLKEIVSYCHTMGAKSIKTAAMLDKPSARLDDGLKQADFVGACIPDKYVFGMGLDYHDYLRNVPAVYQVADEHMDPE